MPFIIEFDKTNGEIVRVFSAADAPNNAAHLSYQTIPPNCPPIDLSMSMDDAMKIINDHLDDENNQDVTPSKPPQPAKENLKFEDV